MPSKRPRVGKPAATGVSEESAIASLLEQGHESTNGVIVVLRRNERGVRCVDDNEVRHTDRRDEMIRSGANDTSFGINAALWSADRVALRIGSENGGKRLPASDVVPLKGSGHHEDRPIGPMLSGNRFQYAIVDRNGRHPRELGFKRC